MTSASDEDDYDDEQPLYDDYEEHMQYMAARERLQEFPGRIPPRKKRNSINAQPRKFRVSFRLSFVLLVSFEPYILLFSHYFEQISCNYIIVNKNHLRQQ